MHSHINRDLPSKYIKKIQAKLIELGYSEKSKSTIYKVVYRKRENIEVEEAIACVIEEYRHKKSEINNKIKNQI